jgi:DNA-binding transcriptional LysR family regulator
MSPELLPHLETFAEVAERGSFTGAARRLGISQPAVSQRVQQLERRLGAGLFHRKSGGVTLTDAGTRLHGYVRRILDLTAEARADITGSPRVTTGELLLAASSVPGHHLLPPALAEFRKQHPAVQVRVSVSDTDAVVRELEHGQAHLGLVGGEVANPHLEFRSFARDELVLVVPRRHPWWRKKCVTPAELVVQPLVQRERGSGSRRCLERALERLGAPARTLAVVLELGSSEAVKEAVLAGLGLAVLSRRAVRNEVRAGQLRGITVAGLALGRDIFVVRDRRRVLPAPAQLFLNHINASSAASRFAP